MEVEVKEKYKALFGRVIIKRDIKEKTTGGIIIVDAKRNANSVGVIVDLGETAGWVETYDKDGNRIPVQTLKKGQKVIFGRHSGTWLDATYGAEKDDGTLFICQDSDILAILEE